MKKVYILMVVVSLMATACNKKSKDLIYNGENPIMMVFRDTIHLDIKSDYDVTISSDNNINVEVLNGGYIHGRNVCEGKITMDNGYNKLTIPVNVELFKEPTFDFGCTAEDIIQQHGVPYCNYGDTTLQYAFVSYACPEMDFYLNSRYNYYESDVYITKNSEYLLGQYFENNFVFDTTYINSEGKECDLYHSKADATLKCGKIANVNQWEEFCLFYYRR